MEINQIVTNHFVKSEDLNHHGTLFAGRTAEWFVEAGLMAATAYLPAENVVCVKIHGMTFTKPVSLGETVRFVSKVINTGTTSLMTSIRLFIKDSEVLDGFITFVNVDKNGNPCPHGLLIVATSEEDIALCKQARSLLRIN